MLGEYDASGNPLYETIYLGSTPVGAMKQTGSAAGNDLTTSLYNVYADHIDTPRVITRQDHTIVWRWDTAEAFGSKAPNQNPSGLGTFVFNQRFPGQVFDQETGLNQNWNRDYDPWIGRYTQFDLIGLDGGINGYLYVENRPIMSTDLMGLQEDVPDPTVDPSLDRPCAVQCQDVAQVPSVLSRAGRQACLKGDATFGDRTNLFELQGSLHSTIRAEETGASALVVQGLPFPMQNSQDT